MNMIFSREGAACAAHERVAAAAKMYSNPTTISLEKINNMTYPVV